MDNTYELWLLITLGLIFLVAVVAHLTAPKEWDHLETCKRTREGMARMIHRE